MKLTAPGWSPERLAKLERMLRPLVENGKFMDELRRLQRERVREALRKGES